MQFGLFIYSSLSRDRRLDPHASLPFFCDELANICSLSRDGGERCYCRACPSMVSLHPALFCQLLKSAGSRFWKNSQVGVPVLFKYPTHLSTALFRQTVSENEQLKQRVTELERELSVWKLALAKSDEDTATLKGTNAHLESVLGSLKVNYQLGSAPARSCIK